MSVTGVSAASVSSDKRLLASASAKVVAWFVASASVIMTLNVRCGEFFVCTVVDIQTVAGAKVNDSETFRRHYPLQTKHSSQLRVTVVVESMRAVMSWYESL